MDSMDSTERCGEHWICDECFDRLAVEWFEIHERQLTVRDARNFLRAAEANGSLMLILSLTGLSVCRREFKVG